MARTRSLSRLVVISGGRHRPARGTGRRHARISGWLLAPAFLIVGGLGGTLLGSMPDASLTRLLDAPAALASASAVSRSFALCAGSVRIDCVVDGDTFWLGGTKIRIADINTPEVSSPNCAAEAALGRRATTRLRELLSAGSFQLQAVDRDEDARAVEAAPARHAGGASPSRRRGGSRQMGGARLARADAAHDPPSIHRTLNRAGMRLRLGP